MKEDDLVDLVDLKDRAIDKLNRAMLRVSERAVDTEVFGFAGLSHMESRVETLKEIRDHIKCMKTPPKSKEVRK